MLFLLDRIENALGEAVLRATRPAAGSSWGHSSRRLSQQRRRASGSHQFMAAFTVYLDGRGGLPGAFRS